MKNKKKSLVACNNNPFVDMFGCCMNICSDFKSPPMNFNFKIKNKRKILRNKMCIYIYTHICMVYSTLILSVNSFCQMMMPHCCVQTVLCNVYTIHDSLSLSFSLSFSLFPSPIIPFRTFYLFFLFFFPIFFSTLTQRNDHK